MGCHPLYADALGGVNMGELWEYYDPHDTIAWYYDSHANIFYDASFGCPIFDIHRFLHPWQIMIFKHDKMSWVFPDITNSFLIELEYLDVPF